MNKRTYPGTILLAILVPLLLWSCTGKTCDQQRGELTPIDLSYIHPQGNYRLCGVPADVDTVPTMSIHGDTVIVSYKRKGKMWKLYYTTSYGTTVEISKKTIYE